MTSTSEGSRTAGLGSGDEEQRLTGPLFVIIEKLAVGLPATYTRPSVDVDYDGLQVLASLAGAPDDGTAAATTDHDALIEELTVRGHLTAGAAGPRPPTLERVDSDLTLVDDDADYALVRPVVLRLDGEGFVYLGHDGATLCVLTAREVFAARSLLEPGTVAMAEQSQDEALGDNALSRDHFQRLAADLLACGLLQEAALATTIDDRETLAMKRAVADIMRRRAVVKEFLAERAKQEAERVARTGVVRTRVVPVNKEEAPLLSLGMVMSYAMAVDDERLQEAYEFVPDWTNTTVPALSGDEPPAIFLFSNYIWSHTWNMKASSAAKEKNPNGVCIHGGPDSPKYADDLRIYLAANPHIDVVVHGEGEVTLAEILDRLEGKLGDQPPDLRVLDDVPGITYRIGAELFQTGARERTADLDEFPSPYANGLFDSVGDIPLVLQSIETNRGCPYGCTFCDWGSATQSRIRQFDLQRVFDDLEWCAKHKSNVVFNTDSNFGIFRRDVEIARKVVELKQKYGYPRVFESSYAKNTIKHLREIIEIMAEGGIISTGTLSLQSVDPGTLDAIKRSNIKVEKYDELATEFGNIKLPLIVELMMGLPGSTLDSFQKDLQQCIDREVQARVNPTEVLVNSPMNEPDYRTEHEIDLARPIADDWNANNSSAPTEKALILSTSSFTREDYTQMDRQRHLFLLMENYGVLRHVARYVRHELGTLETEFYRRLDADAHVEPTRWPTLVFTLDSIGHYMVPPGSWNDFIADVRDYLVSSLGIADDTALDTVLTVQHALLPARDREFPLRCEIRHDYAAWHLAMMKEKQAGWEQDWTPAVANLRTFGAAEFIVEDPQELATLGMGQALGVDTDSDWEFDSAVGRALRFRRTMD